MGQRARSLDEFAECMSRFVTEEGIGYAHAFRPRPSDVIIATYPKAGTTWMQQIVHGLRTRGDMAFDEISGVTPWIELAFDLGIDLSAEHVAEPRAFKSHWNATQVPDGCRYICVLRDPRDTMVSFYRFMNGWFLEPDAVPIDPFVYFIVNREHPGGNYWEHLLSWWRRRDEEDVLMVTFEDLKHDLERQVRRVAGFLELDSDERTIRIATQHAHFDFMKAHESQFDDHLTALGRNAACGLPPDARSTKVRSGKVGSHVGLLSPETTKLLEERWREVVEAETGLPDYPSLRRELTRPR